MPPILHLHHLHLQHHSPLSLPLQLPRSTRIRNKQPHLFSTHNFSAPKHPHLAFCSKDDTLDENPSTQLPEIEEIEGLELRDKPSPSPVSVSDGGVDSPPAPDEVERDEKKTREEKLAPFLKFFKPKGGATASGEAIEEEDEIRDLDEAELGIESIDQKKKINVEYYEPKSGEFVVGVVVSGNENKLDVNIGADLLGTMLTKEVMPLYRNEMDYLLCDVKNDCEEFCVKGRVGIVKDEAALSGGTGLGRPVVENGTVLFAEVLGRTLSGRPLLSTRRLFRRIAWARARQIKELNEPIEVKITEWNTGGLLTRIEGLRAFLPKIELVQRVNNFKELKESVGRRFNVLITRINETNNDLILSEKDAWEGALLEGTVKTIFPYGAQVRIGESNRSGLLHISKISRKRVSAVSDVLKVDEKVKALVVMSSFDGKISLSTAELESEPGLFLSDKERVFAEAEDMAKKYRQKLPATPKSVKVPPNNSSLFDQDSIVYANWKWFKFESDTEQCSIERRMKPVPKVDS
ncbi:Protein PIGMENT DEFECTIVE 338, chloroplastic [Linum perenne]